ncbi:MAG: protein kinase [Deltaproteobacteria bacterium]|nr:protein kinase [Deltaproteobacteria bacterium]
MVVRKNKTHPEKDAADALDPLSRVRPSRNSTAPVFVGDFRPGEIIDGRFKIIEKIGRGGMAAVYRALQTSIHRPVALKILNPRFKRDKVLEARFRNEAALASRLNHPNTVTVFDFGITDKKDLYIAMELVDGENLGTELRRQRIIHWRRACRIAHQIAESLQDAHNNNIIHRDLKPENIMLTRTQNIFDVVKVLDFGIAKILTDDEVIAMEGITSPNQVFGTPEYMSPEQVATKELDPRTDVYSLGIVMYRMITGTLPFKGENPILTMSEHLLKAPPPFETVNSKLRVPANLVDLIFSMLKKRRDQRPGSMRTVVERLDELLDRPTLAPDTLTRPGSKLSSQVISLPIDRYSSRIDSDISSTVNDLTEFDISTPDSVISGPLPWQHLHAEVCGTETVLIAEDDDMVRHMLCKKLEKYGYNILEIEDASDGIRLAREHDGPVHLLLTDVVMPEMNGKELYQKLTPEFPDLKVLYMSGYTNDDIVHHGVIDDNVDFVHKPISLRLLAAKLRELLDRPEA